MGIGGIITITTHDVQRRHTHWVISESEDSSMTLIVVYHTERNLGETESYIVQDTENRCDKKKNLSEMMNSGCEATLDAKGKKINEDSKRRMEEKKQKSERTRSQKMWSKGKSLLFFHTPFLRCSRRLFIGRTCARASEVCAQCVSVPIFFSYQSFPSFDK